MTGTYEFKDSFLSNQEEQLHKYPTFPQGNEVPVVIDNGSFRCRAGWGNDAEPKLDFRNFVTRQRSKREGEVQIGNNISNLEAVRWLLRTQFDRDVVTHFDVQEQIFDHVFHHLGIESEGQLVEHPVLMTEVLCNPNYSRHLMSELLFECYQVPKVAYGVDALFSLHHSQPMGDTSDGLVVSFGYHNTCILPYLNSRLETAMCRRVNVGGYQQATFLSRALQLKYPSHFSAINNSRVEELLWNFAHISNDYKSELKSWSDPDYYKRNVCKIQLPFTPVNSWSDDTKQARLQKLTKEIDDVVKMWTTEEQNLIPDFQEQWQEFHSDVSSAFQALFNTLNKYNSLAENCVKQLQKGITLLKDTADNNAFHDWSEGLKNCHHSLCENRSDWLNQKEVLRQKFLDGETEDGEEKDEAQEIDTEDFSEQETKRKLLVALELMEEKMRPEEGESRKVGALEQLLRDVEAIMNSHSIQKKMTFDVAEYYQLHLGTELIRVPEILFQPSIAGMDQGGVAETMEFILSLYDQDNQSKLVQNVYLTGGLAAYPSMVERVEAELRAVRPFQSTFKVTKAADPALDAWKGAAKWSMDPNLMSEGSITKADYLEKGGEYLKEHSASNTYYPTAKR
ncbi:actin-related protein 5-like [Apostichopus japonicus]|uniref:actin-related protein 5-like n=1 Tax=Stichopus japonicus TaxID=307972 RepID=UPI003AB54B61